MTKLEKLLTIIQAMPGYVDATNPTNEAVETYLNESVDQPITSLTGNKVFTATDGAEFAALADAKQQLWMAFCGQSEIDPWDSANITFLQWVFGSNSTTQANLAALRVAGQQPRWLREGLREMDSLSRLWWINEARTNG